MNADEVKGKLADNAEGVCMMLLPNGKRRASEWHIGGLSGEAGSSMRVHLEAPKAGLWADFNSGEKGSNLLELWKCVKNCSFKDALDEARSYLGVSVENHHIKPVVVPRKPSEEITIPNTMVDFEGRCGAYLHEKRGLPKESIVEYDIRYKADRNELAFVYWSNRSKDSIDMVKYMGIERTDGKKHIYTSKNSVKTLYGKHTIGDDVSTLTITEGELDAISFHAAGIAAVSVPFGAKWESDSGTDPNMEWIQNDYEFLERFQTIAISMDMDDAGRRASASIVKRLGASRCRLVELPEKDANETFQKHGVSALKEAFETAVYIDPENLHGVSKYKSDVHDLLYSDIARGMPLPWANIPFHIRMNELTVVTGFNGSGKTMLLNYLCVWFASLGQRICIASLEVPVKMSLSYLIRQTAGREKPTDEEFNDGMDWLGDKFWFYDHVGKCSPDDVLETFAYAYKRYGVTLFVIDSFMKLGFGVDEYNKHKEFMDKATQFVNEYDVHIFLVAHARKKESEREEISKMDVKGVSEITDEAHNVMTVWRNKGKEQEIYELTQANDCDSIALAEDIQLSKFDAKFAVVKQRNGDGDEPMIKLWYGKGNRQFYSDGTKIPVTYTKKNDN
jgi:twinkle protein